MMKRLLLLATFAAGAATAQIPANPLGTVTGSVRALDDSARDAARTASDRAAPPPMKTAVDVRAGAAVRVDRGARCYDGTDIYDPDYRDGYYYCERRTSGAAVGAEVRTPG